MPEKKLLDCHGDPLEEGVLYWDIQLEKVSVMKKKENGFFATYYPGRTRPVVPEYVDSRNFRRMGREEAQEVINKLERQAEWIKERLPIKTPEKAEDIASV